MILSAEEFPLANRTVSAQFECPKGRRQRGGRTVAGFDLAAICRR